MLKTKQKLLLTILLLTVPLAEVAKAADGKIFGKYFFPCPNIR